MPTLRYRRQFSSGSKPTPDPYDRFLDVQGFFRKHTARDSSCLFRVVSEQVYDTQDYHQQIRKDCVNYMIKYRHQYESDINGDFDEYIRKLAKIETYGGLIELRAMGYMFKRNIMLYEPYDLGVMLVDEPEYKEPFLRVFQANGSHFDSIFTKSFIIKAAFCQSIVYETLYKDVFKLPDIEYSVEMMLHSINDLENNTMLAQSEFEYENDDNYASHIVFKDGRKFELDRPENTLCILDDSKLCNFHNDDFENAIKQFGDEYVNDQRSLQRFMKSSLPDKYNSCVRQLLNSAITPFPYKVAKALDPDIYRNIEFDSWNEYRKMVRSKRRPEHIFKIGAKCLVKLNENSDSLLKCHIQEIDEKTESCIVYIEKISEKRSIPMKCLQLLNATEPYTRRFNQCDSTYDKGYFDECENEKRIDYRSLKQTFATNQNYSESFASCENSFCDAIYKTCDLDSYTNLANFQPINRFELIAMPMQYTQTPNMSANNNSNSNAGNSTNNNSIATAKNAKNRGQNAQNHVAQQQSNEKNQTQSVSLSKAADGNSYNAKNVQETKQDAPVQTQPHVKFQQTAQGSEHAIEANSPAGNHPNQASYSYYPPTGAPMLQYAYCPATSEYGEQGYYSLPAEIPATQGFYTVPSNVYPGASVPTNAYTPIPANQMYPYPMPINAWSSFNPTISPQGYVLPVQQTVPVATISPHSMQQFPFLRRDLLVSHGRINYNSSFAYSPNADDLPLNDKVSIRFFYNLGIEYFKHLQSVHGLGHMMALIDGDVPFEANSSDVDSQQSQLTSDFQQLTFDGNDIEQPTPSKQKSYSDYSYRRNSGLKPKRDNNRSNYQRNFQGSFQGYHVPRSEFQGPINKHPKQKQHQQSAPNNNYDTTPVKEPKNYQHANNGNNNGNNGSNNNGNNHNSLPKRDQYPVIDGASGIVFGSNVPPFPFYMSESNDQHYVSPNPPPVNAFQRITTPQRSSSVPVGVPPYEIVSDGNDIHNSGYQYMHAQQPPIQHLAVPYHAVPNNQWIPTYAQIPPQQQHHPVPNQSHSQSLNTSNASNISGGTNTGSNPSQ